MQKKSKLGSRLLGLLVVCVVLLGIILPSSVRADTVRSDDFRARSFSKVVDWFEYVRQYALANGFTPPDTSEHAYLYTNYINVGGFQLFYVGLVNATHNGRYVTVPLQSFFEHYKTPAGKTAVTASSFISLVAFNDTATSLYPDSPDRNDQIYASFTLGVDVTQLAGRQVEYTASSEIIPLTSPDDNHWSWGLRYRNLNAIWWRTYVDPLFPHFDLLPSALSRYSELTFQYDLTIDPAAKTAKLTASYTIGKMTELWILGLPVQHLNSTGTYYLNGTQASSQTIYDFLQAGQYKISIVLAQKSILVSQNATTPVNDRDGTGASVDDAERDVSATSVVAETSDGERVFEADFGVKPTYQLYDSSDANPATYDAVTRTVRRPGWGGNPVFWFQNRFMGFLPLFVAHVDAGLLQKVRSGLANFEASDYLYIISYKQWGGTKIVHDPDFTAFFQPSSNAALFTSIFIAVAAAATVGGVFAFLLRRRRAANVSFPGYPGQGPQSPGPSPAGPPAPSR